MELTKEFAEILGMFAADGCLQKKYICMWGNIHEDKEYYDNIVCPLFSKVFNKKVVAHEKKSNGVYGFYICDKEVIDTFKELGFIRNKTYTVKAPNEIIKSDNQEIYSAFIRGFTDCDGGISFMKRKGKYSEFKTKYNTYPRISIGVVSANIINDLSNMLHKLKVKHTVYKAKKRKNKWGEVYRITIRGPERVEDWMKKIGFDNPAQLTRYAIWKKFGTCPPKSTIEQRKKILEGKINPLSI